MEGRRGEVLNKRSVVFVFSQPLPPNRDIKPSMKLSLSLSLALSLMKVKNKKCINLLSLDIEK